MRLRPDGNLLTRRPPGIWKELATSTITFPLGPYHPALSQPLALTLKLRGETIAAVEPPETGYCRRGIAELAENRSVEDTLALVERTCALSGATYRLALCQALESATNTSLSAPARLTRVFFSEVERILARLWTLALTARAAGQTGPFHDALEQRETLFTALETVTGQRAFWGIAVPGGVRDDLDLEPLQAAVKRLEPAIATWQAATSPRGPLGRVGAGVGVISAEQADALSLSGLAARGSVQRADMREERPYSGYTDLDIAWPSASDVLSGDVAARMVSAVEDIATSVTIAESSFSALTSAHTNGKVPSWNPPRAAQRARSAVEGPHGHTEVQATVTPAGQITRLQLETPGSSLLAALPQLLDGRPLGQVPMILASLDLCLECLDL